MSDEKTEAYEAALAAARAEGARQKLEKRAPELLAMLRELEWAGDEGAYEFEGAACPICGAGKTVWTGEPRPGRGRHEPDCRLATLLAECDRE